MDYLPKKNQMTKCDYVVEQLKEQIVSGAYKSGDQLPPEGALCELFGVSRITVREALKKLNMMGLVEIKQGKGTFVKTVDLGLFMKPLLQLIDFEEINVEAIYTTREYIEGGTVADIMRGGRSSSCFSITICTNKGTPLSIAALYLLMPSLQSIPS